MAENDLEYAIRVFGGLNVSDQEDALVMRSHQQTQQGYVQTAPAESPSLKNIDFTKAGFQKRLGSTADSDFSTTVAAASDALVAGCEFVDSDSTDRYEIIVSKKTIYMSKNDADYVQLNDSASAAYTHADDVTKAGFAFTDGHLFIGLSGANQIQTFKRGDDLDDEMKLNNTYEEAHSTDDHVITGTWPTGCYLLTTIHTRLVFSDADIVLYYTPMAYTASSGIWELGSAFFFTQGRILSLDSMSPEYSDSLDEVLYVGTENGFEVLTGFDPSADTIKRVHGSQAPLNHQTTAVSKNWLVYLTAQKSIYAINKNTVIDLGRRLKNTAQDGPLDNMVLTSSLTNSFGIYNQETEQAHFFYTTDSTYFNDTCITLDFKLGEPVMGENQNGFEQRVRCLYWQIVTPADNDWFIHAYQVRGKIQGMISTGTIWNFLTDDDDLDSLAVEGSWKSSIFLGGGEGVNKQFEQLTIRSLPKGTFTVTTNIFINRATSAEKTFTYDQYVSGYGIWGTAVWDTGVWASTQLVKGINDVDLYADAIQWEVTNVNTDEPFEMANMSLKYLIGAEER